MLSRIFMVWIVYAGIVGFLVGGSVVSSFYVFPTEQDDLSHLSDKSKTDDTLARYTWWLTVCTAGVGLATVALCIATIGLYVTGEKQTRVALKAANAAELNARAAVAVELPIIRMTAGMVGYGNDQDKKGKKRYVAWVSSLKLSNQGRTKAFPVELHLGCTIGDDLPRTPTYTFTKVFPVDAILDPEKAEEIELAEFDFETSLQTFELLQFRGTDLWFYCNLIYQDFMNERHEAGFCWKQHETIGPGILVADATPAYNRTA